MRTYEELKKLRSEILEMNELKMDEMLAVLKAESEKDADAQEADRLETQDSIKHLLIEMDVNVSKVELSGERLELYFNWDEEGYKHPRYRSLDISYRFGYSDDRDKLRHIHISAVSWSADSDTTPEEINAMMDYFSALSKLAGIVRFNPNVLDPISKLVVEYRNQYAGDALGFMIDVIEKEMTHRVASARKYEILADLMEGQLYAKLNGESMERFDSVRAGRNRNARNWSILVGVKSITKKSITLVDCWIYTEEQPQYNIKAGEVYEIARPKRMPIDEALKYMESRGLVEVTGKKFGSRKHPEHNWMNQFYIEK